MMLCCLYEDNRSQRGFHTFDVDGKQTAASNTTEEMHQTHKNKQPPLVSILSNPEKAVTCIQQLLFNAIAIIQKGCNELQKVLDPSN